ncbi:VWA domain-containing protein [Alteromonas sediminis]|uniref:VWA domain-containing protein n=1 Tax=Alteromonas sediminis TaxID=2259342 RepID=A0A3N5YQ74_9ALTE|nr:vWA domain-containing protein [Alteromonas sediminis]RPJ68171.1 VWA domain-containing protein [Alteromonas sediminis]
MVKRRQEEGFNLSFLDVMACGLGAVLMILILVKFQGHSSMPDTEVERLEQALAAQSAEKSQQQSALTLRRQSLKEATATQDDLTQKITSLRSKLQDTQNAINDEKAIIAELEQAIAAAAPEQADDPIELVSKGEEKYLIGLSIQGTNIGILLDTSASMTDDDVVSIIRRKIANDEVKKQGPKWKRSVNVAKWMLARLPTQANVSVVSFNKEAKVLGQNKINQADDSTQLATLLSEIDELVPTHGTDLSRALQTITAAMPTLSHLYVITDGLPTLLSEGSGFQESRGCRPVSGNDTTITGDCRMRLFLHAFKQHAPKVPTSIVLLPLEGDSQAQAAYWDWADISGGTMISPAGNWP